MPIVLIPPCLVMMNKIYAWIERNRHSERQNILAFFFHFESNLYKLHANYEEK